MAPDDSAQPVRAPVAAPGADDGTAWTPGEHGTPEQRLDRALTDARSRVRASFAANEAQRAATGAPILAGKHYVDGLAAHAEWARQAASALAGYAREINATAPAVSASAGDPLAPYNQGRRDAFEKMLRPDFDHARSSGRYDTAEWRDYAAGLAAAAQHLATDAAAAIQRAHRSQSGSVSPVTTSVPHALAAESFPHGPAVYARPDRGFGTSTSRSAQGQSPPAGKGRGPR